MSNEGTQWLRRLAAREKTNQALTELDRATDITLSEAATAVKRIRKRNTAKGSEK